MFLENKANILYISALQMPFIHPGKPFTEFLSAGCIDKNGTNTSQKSPHIHNSFFKCLVLMMMALISLKMLY